MDVSRVSERTRIQISSVQSLDWKNMVTLLDDAFQNMQIQVVGNHIGEEEIGLVLGCMGQVIQRIWEWRRG